MFRRASRICWVGTWRRFSHLRLPLKCPNWISSVSMAPKRVSKLKLAISSRLTPISLRQSSNRPTQSLKVPIFATLPGISQNLFTTEGTEEHRGKLIQPLCSSVPSVVDAFSFRLELRRTLLHVCRQAFFCILALEKQLLVFPLDSKRRLHRDLPAGLHCALDPSHGFRGFVGRAELARVLHDVFHEAFALVNVVDDPEFERLFERKSVSRDHQLDGFALAHKPRQTLGSTRTGKDAQVHLGQADFAGIFAGDAEVGRHGDFQPAPNAVSVDRRNY